MSNKECLDTQIAIIKEVAAAITSTNNLDSITNLILDLALSYTNAKGGSIMLLDEKGDLTIKAARGIEPELAQTVRVKVGEYICGRVAAQKTPLLVNDIDSDEELGTKRTHKYKTKSFMSFPVLMKDKLLGVININDKIDGSFFTEDEFDLINVLASQTAIALEHALLMSELRALLMSELRSKALELDERNKGLIDIDRLKTEFIARMSHELRTPLNSITGAVYYLKEKKTSQAEQSEFVNIISDEANKLINLLDGLLNFSRLERDEVLFRKKVINLKDVIEKSVCFNRSYILLWESQNILNPAVQLKSGQLIQSMLYRLRCLWRDRAFLKTTCPLSLMKGHSGMQ
jgi:putative methionine-R-sulfoxide reductase with GAF domain